MRHPDLFEFAHTPSRRAVSSDPFIDTTFDSNFANDLARVESYNKHLYRPNTYLHKWWARRCGSTFRLILKHLVKDPEMLDYCAWRTRGADNSRPNDGWWDYHTRGDPARSQRNRRRHRSDPRGPSTWFSIECVTPSPRRGLQLGHYHAEVTYRSVFPVSLPAMRTHLRGLLHALWTQGSL